MIELKAMPFDAREKTDPATGEVSYDRIATSKDYANWMAAYFDNGILVPKGGPITDQLKVSHKSGLSLAIQPGQIVINGRTAWVTQAETIDVEMGGSLPRIDRIVAELNIPDDRGIYIKVLQGTPASSPQPPELTRTEDVFQMSLAQVRVTASSAVVSEVVDERREEELCGLSNVKIGIKPILDAKSISLSEETKSIYGVETINEALLLIGTWMPYPSYLVFCSGATQDGLNGALGYRNEEKVSQIGLQLAMYAWFKGTDRNESPFRALITCNTMQDIINNQNAMAEIMGDEYLLKLLSQSAYGDYFNEKCWMYSFKALSVILGLNPNDYSNYSAFWSNESTLVKIAESSRDNRINKIISYVFDGQDPDIVKIIDNVLSKSSKFTKEEKKVSASSSDIYLGQNNQAGFYLPYSASSINSKNYEVSISSTYGKTFTDTVNTNNILYLNNLIYLRVINVSTKTSVSLTGTLYTLK